MATATGEYLLGLRLEWIDVVDGLLFTIYFPKEVRIEIK